MRLAIAAIAVAQESIGFLAPDGFLLFRIEIESSPIRWDALARRTCPAETHPFLVVL